MADSTLSSFLEALQNIRGAGRFCAHGSLPFVPPGIVLKNGEDLALPLSTSQAGDLRALAEPAPYGMGSETRLDESVRKCWQIDASELSWISPKWQQAMETLAGQIAQDLGVEGEVRAEPYKLLLYDKGGFFLPHRDTEKAPGMFGTLIVSLPSRHSGGALILRHQGKEERCDFGSAFDPAEICWAAFFADCEHEVQPVTGGHRLCLAYNLILTNKKGKKSGMPTSGGEALVPGLLHISQTRGDDITAVLLEHRYTEESLSVAALKGDDRARARALFAAAGEAGLTARLALVSLHQMGQLEERYDEDYYRSRRGKRGRSDEAVEGEMGEIIEEYLTIEHWRTAEDEEEDLGSFSIDEENILSLAELGEGDPDEKFAEGFTGNAGCTMEYWYRRAAIAVWPKDAGPALLARYDFHAACTQFAALTKKERSKAIQLGQAVINEAQRRLEKASEWGADSLGTQMRPLLRGIGQLGDKALYAVIAVERFADAFKNANRDTWIALLNGFGGQPLELLLSQTESGPVSTHRQSWFHALDAMLGHAPDLLPAHAGILPRLVAGRALPSRNDDPDTKPGYHAHLVLAASCVVTNTDDRQSLESWLLKKGDLTNLREVLAPALLEKTHDAWFTKKNSMAPDVLAAAIDSLVTETAQPVEPYPDWQRPAPTDSFSDRLIDDLLRFMTDPNAERHEIKRPQDERLRVESYVKRYQLDVDLETVRKGTPHTLVCQKNDQSYQRALRQRTADERLLAKLKAVGGS